MTFKYFSGIAFFVKRSLLGSRGTTKQPPFFTCILYSDKYCNLATVNSHQSTVNRQQSTVNH
ncbi:MAG: hypothetical protein KME64_06105 [Scytonematopsis contorta HA4267-MV1]|nr:hypothetical protein [Scytonematopsis contorta HA4267-MV1]